MKNIVKPFALTALALLALTGCMTEKERQAIAAEKARQEQLARAERERQEREARAERERQEREALAQKKQKAKQLMADKKWQDVVDFCGDESDAELVEYVKIARQHLAQEVLRRERAARVEAMAVSYLESIRKAYSEGEAYTCPFPRENRGGDWLAKWTEPCRDLSDEDKLAGESRLEAFGTKYLPNAYANYEKAREAAKELQQIFNEEFPQPWTIKNTSPKWNAFNKALEKFTRARMEYFLCRDELCHYWMRWRLGVLNAGDLEKVDSQKLAVGLLPENIELAAFGLLNLTPMEGKDLEFAAKYAPESYAIYQKLTRDLNTQDALLKEVFAESRTLDHVRYDRALTAAVMMRNDSVRELNVMSLSLQTWRMDHRIADKTSEDVATCDHAMALQLKPFVDSLPSYVKERTLGPVIPTSDLVLIPGSPNGNYWIQRTEVTQIQWMTVMGNNPSRYKGADHPVENVSWNDCQEFIKRLNKMDGTNYRLPSKAEWEFACRAGSTGDWGKRRNGEEGPLEVMGWYDGNSKNGTHPVGMKEPNAFGLYDMHGNVWEWCEDLYRAGASRRVYRGGSWCNSSRGCAAGARGYYDPDYRYDHLGFRLAAFQDVNR